MDETVCILCGEGDGGKSLQLLGTKGAATINTLAKTYQRPDIVATVGDHVHPHCRKAFGRHPNYKQRPETKINLQLSAGHCHLDMTVEETVFTAHSQSRNGKITVDW